MAMDRTRLRNALKPVIEQNMRDFILGGDATPYPQMTAFADALAKSIADEVIDEITGFAELDGGCTGVVTSNPGGGGTTVGYITDQPVSGSIT